MRDAIPLQIDNPGLWLAFVPVQIRVVFRGPSHAILLAALAFVSGIVIIARRHPTEQICKHLAFHVGVFRLVPHIPQLSGIAV